MSHAPHPIEQLLKSRILILDGAMGTMIQRYKLTEEHYRGMLAHGDDTTPRQNFASHAHDLKGNNELLVLTQPQVIQEIHEQYLAAGADIIETNTFGATTVAQADYHLEALAFDMNVAGARLARAACDKYSTADKPRFVAGALGPTPKTASISPDVNDPGARNVTFDQLEQAYFDAVRGLVEGGADLLLVETIFDTLNAKAALFAIERYFDEYHTRLPVMISGTVTDASGRILSGQTVEAFWNSVRHVKPLTIGLNCALGAVLMRQYAEEMATVCDTYTCMYPNAGLPNPMSDTGFDETPEMTSGFLREFAQSGFVNIVGGCCGTTPEHIQAIAKAVAGIAPRQVPVIAPQLRLSGLEPCNNLNLIASEPDISRVPLMIDSSKWTVIEAGLKCVQGKAIVNSISMKEGEAEFIKHATLVRRYGAATVVMAFDEQGQADTFQRKIDICKRSYDILVNQVGFSPEDIIFDPNIFAISTGIEEHNNYAVDFIEATAWIRKNLPYAKISGGVSNVSFSFRGNDAVREAIHTVFLYHAIKAGMTMGIVNAGQLGVYEEIPRDLRDAVEDVVLNRRPDAGERLVTMAENIKGGGKVLVEDFAWRKGSLQERITHALVRGITTYIVEDTEEARLAAEFPVEVIEGPLIIGLSGLITPSLEEMAHVAKEMQRQGFTLPLLIGGATTSRIHTAVKIEPGYTNGPTIYVTDASRAVGVCSNLLSATLRDDYVAGIQAEYAKARTQHAAKKGKGARYSLAAARAHGFKTDWKSYAPPKPWLMGVHKFESYPLDKIAEYIDWTPFFQTWELAGRYPKILSDEVVGEAARNVFEDAKAMLKRIIDEKWLQANAVFGLFPANSVNDDDIEIYTDESRNKVAMTWHNLRQQMVKPEDRPNRCLADLIAPKDSGVADYIGAFAVTSGIGIDARVAEFEKNLDDYNSIMLKALADRLAEAFAELLHARVRREFWGYAADESLDNAALIDGKYRGIRPAPGYPACPDHTEKEALFDLLNAPQNAGITLTESFAMLPTAAVSGFYFSHPESQYFASAKVDKDQVEDYARRKGWTLEETERWLAPVLNY